MKNALLIVFLLLGGFLVRGQEKNWSIEINYPVSINDAFGSSNQGTIGAGLKYRFADLGKARLGVSLDGTWFSTTIINDTDPIQELDYRDFFLQPRIFAELPITANNKFRFLGGLGWTWSRSVDGFAFFDEQGEIQGGQDWYNGLNLNLGITYDVSPRVFIHTQYDLIFLSGNRSNRTIGLLKLGGGFRF